jgi:hypothetical protein
LKDYGEKLTQQLKDDISATIQQLKSSLESG